ncbi:hypothetical protein [Sphingomonas cavernae]|uniref:Uncharacterized protein n=1 Tax=Sphingomonas cavernae TaxID=2320861 RepID=A0A418WL11_9SPHN|nr:hypothetical protein [Sphingomonas cavernae]RJF90698.1 hypothetical protein D3876_10850 [Sphingomonas cavernae]
MAPYVADRACYDEAVGLMARFGDDAGFEAAARADVSRDRGNVRNFCRWRQIERLIVHLSREDAPAVVH